MRTAHLESSWIRKPILQIEDLSEAVAGAGLEATQMSRGEVSGGIAFSNQDELAFASGLIDGRVALFGPLSPDRLTLGVGIHLESGTRHWLKEVASGGVGVFMPGDEHDAIYTRGSIYASVSLTAERLEAEAARRELVLDRRTLGGSGVHHRKIAPAALADLESRFRRIHEGGSIPGDDATGEMLLNALIEHLARKPCRLYDRNATGGHVRIVARARAYIADHLSEPISVDEIAAQAYTSRRTLFRAFADVLDDTPRGYVRRLRLHRIRHDVASDTEKTCTIAMAANQWGISDIGRMPGWYRELFGELPSETLAKALGTARRSPASSATPFIAPRRSI